jgi:hypothetical protein
MEWIMRRAIILALGFCAASLTTSPAAAQALDASSGLALASPVPVEHPDVRVTATYSSSVLIFKVGEITLQAAVDADGYTASTHIEAAGLAALFTDFDIRAEVSGARLEAGMRPLAYNHVERTGDKVRRVDIDFRAPIAESLAEPPFGSLGVPPASAAQRRNVIDPISSLFLLSEVMNAPGRDICSGTIPVFDGKARYDLQLQSAGTERTRTRAWRGDALICHVWYHPIAGYDPEDYPSESELRHPLTLWLAEFEDGAFYMPVRLHTRAGFGGVTIEAREIDIQAR